MTDTETRTYTVRGMSCEHCRASVSDEVGALAGVASVEVALESGRLEVRGSFLRDDEVRAAVEEAGYDLVRRA